ncbi:Uncharacterised protein [Chlamydia trachomatis]|nr:Uncharacterised protein [Chlamydia trachomatis]
MDKFLMILGQYHLIGALTHPSKYIFYIFLVFYFHLLHIPDNSLSLPVDQKKE